ncbi:MAG: hypothetical protein GX096_10215 [Clostridiales bacterium]|nr:hypothetical protein [Clostridiales bacterium]
MNGDVIKVDIDHIAVPDVSALPILSVSPAPRVDDRLLSGYQVSGNAVNALLYSTGELSINKWWNGNKMNYGQSASFHPDHIELENHADDNGLSLGEAIDMVTDEVTRLYGESLASSMQLTAATVFSKAYHLEKNNSSAMSDDPVDQPDNIGFYAMTFDQGMHGIPIIGVGGGDYDYLKMMCLHSPQGLTRLCERPMYFILGHASFWKTPSYTMTFPFYPFRRSSRSLRG